MPGDYFKNIESVSGEAVQTVKNAISVEELGKSLVTCRDSAQALIESRTRSTKDSGLHLVKSISTWFKSRSIQMVLSESFSGPQPNLPLLLVLSWDCWRLWALHCWWSAARLDIHRGRDPSCCTFCMFCSSQGTAPCWCGASHRSSRNCCFGCCWSCWPGLDKVDEAAITVAAAAEVAGSACFGPSSAIGVWQRCCRSPFANSPELF